MYKAVHHQLSAKTKSPKPEFWFGLFLPQKKSELNRGNRNKIKQHQLYLRKYGKFAIDTVIFCLGVKYRPVLVFTC
jgi:hypothetical protein